jgi:hypothetical protein
MDELSDLKFVIFGFGANGKWSLLPAALWRKPQFQPPHAGAVVGA